MSVWAKLLLLLTITWLTASAATVSFVGPDNPGTTLSCNPVTDTGCVTGDPGTYSIYGVQLTQPTASGQPWTLTIETDYPPCSGAVGCTSSHSIVPGAIIPTSPSSANDLLYSIPDFLINWNNTDYGVVLAPHVAGGASLGDGYTAGNLYQAPGELTAGAIGIPGAITRENIPIWLAAGGSLLGSGTVSVVSGGSGTPAEYTITDTFFAPATFLSTGSFSINAASYPCANGVVLGVANFVGTTGTFTPEPGTFLLAFPALLLFARARHFARKIRP